MQEFGNRVYLKSVFFVFTAFLLFLSAFSVCAQEPVIVQPGAPGQPSKKLPSGTTGKLPLPSGKDVEFMQGMIHHHGQAVEMTALIEARTQNKEVRLIGAKISQSQSDEIKFMKRWLETRGEKTEKQSDMPNMSAEEHARLKHTSHILMPGMLTPKEMEKLKQAKGAEFDRLFLKGMIKHHEGALVMVKELFEAPGAGQDAVLFNFAGDVDTGQRGEIKIMKAILEENLKEEK